MMFAHLHSLKERTTHHRTSGKSTSLLILFLLFFTPQFYRKSVVRVVRK